MQQPMVIEVPVDVGRPAQIAARCFPPAETATTARPVWIVGLPGAGEDWRYFDTREPPGSSSEYSFAAHLNARGFGVIAFDTLGTSDSTFDGHADELSFELVASANDQAVAAVRHMLRRGALGADAAQEAVICGVGHSGGGGVAVAQQGGFGSFDLLAVLGMPVGPFDAPGSADDVRRTITVDERGLMHILEFTDDMKLRHFPGASPALVETYTANMVGFPPSMAGLMVEGTIANPAAQITSPVFLGFGQFDLALDPLGEAARYPRSQDATVYVQRDCGHIHNIAPSRRELWDSLANWIWSRVEFGAARV